MRSAITILAIYFIYSSITTSAFAFDSEDLMDLSQLPGSRGAVSTQQIIGRERKARVGKGYTKLTGAQDLTMQEIKSKTGDMFADYRKKKKQYAWSHRNASIVANSFTVGMGAATAFAAGTGIGLPVSIILGGATTITKMITDSTLKKIKSKGQKASRSLLADAINRYQKEVNSSVSELLELEPLEVYGRLFTEGSEFYRKLEELPEGDRAVAQGFMIKQIATDFNKANLANLGMFNQTNGEVLKNRDLIINTSVALNRFASKQQRQMGSIIKQQQIVNSKLEQINDLVASNSQDIFTNRKHIGFIEDFMFGKMSPSEQLVALKKGMLANITKGERKALILKTEAVQAKIKLNKQISNYINGASTVLSIADNLGLKGKFFETAGEVVNVVQTGFKAYMSDMSDDPLGYLNAVNIVTGLFAKKRDVVEARHKQIVKMLEGLAAGQEVLSEKIDHLIEGQEQIIKNQQAIVEQLYAIRTQLQDNHQMVMKAMGDLHYTVWETMKIALANREDNLKSCNTFLNSRREYHFFEGKFSKYRDMKGHFRNHFNNKLFSSCMDGINYNIRRYDDIDPLFHFYKQGSTKELSITYRDLYVDSIDLLTHNSGDNFEKYLSSLLQPVTTIRDLDKKSNVTLEPNYFPGPQRSALQNYKYLMGKLLSPLAVSRYLAAIIEIAPYFDVLAPDSTSLSRIDELLDPRFEYTDTGLRLLQRALPILDVALAQQALLSGDTLLFALSEVFEKNQQDKPAYKKATGVLQTNKLLARNYLIYQINKEFKKTGSNSLFYNAALYSTDDDLLKMAIKMPWTFVKKDEGWFVQFTDEIAIKLPTAKAVGTKYLETTPELITLASLKDRFIDQITSYRFTMDMSEEDLQFYNILYLNSI
ncbi:MAG: hypothetical protein ISR65_05270 [Bacteriovoracaceae bacterium]|nr:hypothetical protein [Bacteriovoracaceae bacterium]